MPAIHNADLFGPVGLATDPGSVGQVLTSQGPGAQAIWTTPTPVTATKFTFTSASATSHVIVHNLGNQYPDITVWDTTTGEVFHPDISRDNANQLTITTFVPVAIAGTIVG